MAVLSPDDHAFFRENGYVVIHNAVPQENLDALIEALWEFLGLDRNNPEDWYRPPLPTNGMVEIYQHQALWDNRQYPRLHQIFSEILGSEQLMVSIDRANLKPPQRADHPEYDFKGFTHWDTDTVKKPLEKGRYVQGVLYLSDTDADQGGFQCVPELYRQMEAWVRTQPADRNPRIPDLNGFTVEPIPGKAGDLLIWDVLLAHGNGHNVSDKPRLAQYISMFRTERATPESLEHRIRCWREHCPPGNKTFPGDPRKIEEQYGKTAELTPLGRKLLGVDPW